LIVPVDSSAARIPLWSVEALLDRSGRLVGREDSLVVGDDRLRGLVELVDSHG